VGAHEGAKTHEPFQGAYYDHEGPKQRTFAKVFTSFWGIFLNRIKNLRENDVSILKHEIVADPKFLPIFT